MAANTPSKDVVSEVREIYGRTLDRDAHGTGHYEGCWKDHWACLAEKLLDHIGRITPDETTELPCGHFPGPLTAKMTCPYCELDKQESETTPALTEALCFEGEKDYQLDQLLDYLHYDSDTRSHPDWVARAQTAEAELAKWKANCTGNHGSQMPCVENLPEEPTVEVRAWGTSMDPPPEKASGGPANDFSNLGPPTQEWLDRSQGLTGLEYDEHGERLPEKASCPHEAIDAHSGRCVTCSVKVLPAKCDI